jgi:hypothetical protein
VPPGKNVIFTPWQNWAGGAAAPPLEPADGLAAVLQAPMANTITVATAATRRKHAMGDPE